MAEGFARARHSKLIEPLSAGLYPAAIIQPQTFACMREKEISLKGQHPKPLQAIEWPSVDLVVNMSGVPVLTHLPRFQGHNLMWTVADPIGKSASFYQQVRDQIEKLVDQLAATLKAQQRPQR